MGRNWRLILDHNHRAAYNMAADETILRSYADGNSLPTLRIYGWEKPAVSLGYFQDAEKSKIDQEYCRNLDIEIVRRPTGGRAVVHGWDITFSVAIGERDIPNDFHSVLGSHTWLMKGIIAGFQELGIQAEMGSSERSASRGQSQDCFAHTADCDVRVGKEKVAGAAQVRKWGAILEQGSIPYEPPTIDVFGKSTQGPKSTVLAEIPFKAARMAMVVGFEKALGLHFVATTLSRAETESAFRLARKKYASAEWTYRTGIDNSIMDCYTDMVSSRGGRNHAEENPRR